MVNDSTDVTSSGRPFHICGPATGTARLPTVDSLLIGTARRLVRTEKGWRRIHMRYVLYAFMFHFLRHSV